MAKKSSRVEEFQVTGPEVLTAVKDLVHQGRIRRIAIRNAAGVTLLEIPLVVGVAGAVLVPVWAAVGALAALVARCTLVVERIESDGPREETPAARKAPRRAGPARRRRPA